MDAYARIFATGLTIHFGRVAVAKDSRGQGLAKDMVEQILDRVNRDSGRTIEIEAQEQVVGLYEN